MPYAVTGSISRTPIQGGVKITEEQYISSLDVVSRMFN